MAACDNLYGTKKEWYELREFLAEHRPEWLIFMKSEPSDDCKSDEEFRICNTAHIQKWLIENCPFEWVQEKLNDNFEIQRMIWGKAHHE